MHHYSLVHNPTELQASIHAALQACIAARQAGIAAWRGLSYTHPRV